MFLLHTIIVENIIRPTTEYVTPENHCTVYPRLTYTRSLSLGLQCSYTLNWNSFTIAFLYAYEFMHTIVIYHYLMVSANLIGILLFRCPIPLPANKYNLYFRNTWSYTIGFQNRLLVVTAVHVTMAFHKE